MDYVTRVFPYDEENGMIHLPEKLVEELDLQHGDQLVCTPTADGCLLLSKNEVTE